MSSEAKNLMVSSGNETLRCAQGDKGGTMTTKLYWIEGPWPGRLAILPRPRGGEWLEDEVQSWQQSGLDVVLSLLTQEEIADLALTREAELCQVYGVQFLSFPIEDRGTPASRRAT